jgi:hypothetical protein
MRDRGNSGVSGERECKKWQDIDGGTRREKTCIGWKERKESAERERKEGGEILNEE